MSKNTQLLSPLNFDVNNMLFAKPQLGSIPDSKLTYKRVNISIKNPDGSIGDLVFGTEVLYSFGLTETKSMGENPVVNGYCLPLILHSRDNPTELEMAFIDTINNIVEYVKSWVMDNKEELDKYDLELSDMRKMNPLYYKRDDKKKIIEGSSPSLYLKLMVSKKDGDLKILSKFYNSENDEEIPPMKLLNAAMDAQCAIKFESIFVGTKITLQIKLIEAVITPKIFGNRRLLQVIKRPSSSFELKEEESPNKKRIVLDDILNDDNGSLVDDNEDNEEKIQSVSAPMDVEGEEEDDSVPEPTVAPPPKKIKKIINKRIKKEE